MVNLNFMNFNEERTSLEKSVSPKNRQLSKLEITKSQMKHNFKEIRDQMKAKSALSQYSKYHNSIISKTPKVQDIIKANKIEIP